MRRIHQLFELGIAAKVGIYGEKITGEVAGSIQLVIPPLTRAGVKYRGEPDGVDVEALDVIQAVDDPLQIAVVPGGAITDAIVGGAVTIDERLHHHLIGSQVAGGLVIAITGAAGRGHRWIDQGWLSLAAGATAPAAARCQEQGGPEQAAIAQTSLFHCYLPAVVLLAQSAPPLKP